MKWVKKVSEFNLEGQIRGMQKNQREEIVCKGSLVKEASDSVGHVLREPGQE